MSEVTLQGVRAWRQAMLVSIKVSLAFHIQGVCLAIGGERERESSGAPNQPKGLDLRVDGVKRRAHPHLLLERHLRGWREFFIRNLPVRVHIIIVMIGWTGLASWEFEFPWLEFSFPFPGSLTSTFQVGAVTLYRGDSK